MKGQSSKTSPPSRLVWTDAAPVEAIPSGRSLAIEDQRPFVLHFGLDGWQGVSDRPSFPVRGVQRVNLQRTDLSGHILNFTRFYASEAQWEGVDHVIRIGSRRSKPDV